MNELHSLNMLIQNKLVDRTKRTGHIIDLNNFNRDVEMDLASSQNAKLPEQCLGYQPQLLKVLIHGATF